MIFTTSSERKKINKYIYIFCYASFTSSKFSYIKPRRRGARDYNMIILFAENARHILISENTHRIYYYTLVAPNERTQKYDTRCTAVTRVNYCYTYAYTIYTYNIHTYILRTYMYIHTYAYAVYLHGVIIRAFIKKSSHIWCPKFNVNTSVYYYFFFFSLYENRV